MNSRLRAALPQLLDIVIPAAGYFILHAVGVSDFWALTIAGAATGLNAVANTIRRGRLDGIGALVMLEIALSVALFLVTRDPRIVLMKPAFSTALAGLYLLFTCVVGRPFTFEAGKPFATRGEAGHERAYEAAWAHSPGFRHEQRLLTAVWGMLSLAESVLRVTVVLHTSIAQGVLAGNLPGIIAVAVGIAFTRLRVPHLRRYVQAQQAGDPEQPLQTAGRRRLAGRPTVATVHNHGLTTRRQAESHEPPSHDA
jgi:hypothetical protein